jgi:hypothetical protein
VKEREPAHHRVSVDQEYRYFGYYDRAPEGKCRVRIVERNGVRPILLLTDLPDNPSTSVINMMEYLVPELMREFMPRAFEELELPTVIEHSLPRGKREEMFSLVTFKKTVPVKAWLGGRSRLSLGEPSWKHLPIEEARKILGEIVR